jgi:hypothetical protein
MAANRRPDGAKSMTLNNRPQLSRWALCLVATVAAAALLFTFAQTCQLSVEKGERFRAEHFNEKGLPTRV